MIKTFRCKETEQLFQGRFSAKLPQAIQRTAAMKLKMLHEIVHGRRAITADTALRLGRFFSMEAQFWLNLQSHYDMEVAMDGLQDRLEKEVQPFTRAA